MLAEELSVIDADSPLWSAARPLLDAALRLEQHDDTYIWYGWKKEPINAFLRHLPEHCVLMVGVWDTLEEGDSAQEILTLGCLCEVVRGEVCTIRTFEALAGKDLPPIAQLEPGYEHAFKLMQVAKMQVAPVAWALFTDRSTWNEWLFSESEASEGIDKGELLASLAREGRCVLLGNQAPHHHL
ncbi:hypothetical protein EPA93_20360 [Ktedonosporobacter rubrisoli]|uniref:Uncharacterized protein n=1 Tax=Ktedonosporobacter rubrisoli TaxID=2509675 RepID=A0A4P6JSB5_KTERU|nr:hypothetical protein [Ktedonosporobacter rubrisoli]QBD78225.1 hypothetical protein EPA93_20360 [Ktedonosporobacter rubrisoli]